MASCLLICFGDLGKHKADHKTATTGEPSSSSATVTTITGGINANSSGDNEATSPPAAECELRKKVLPSPQRRTALHLAAESGHIGVLQTLFESLLCSALAPSSLTNDAGGEGGGGSGGVGASEPGTTGGGSEAAPGSETTTGLEFLRSIINARDSKQQTPLLIAASRGHSDCVRFLLSNGADRRRGDVKGNTPLHVASARGFLTIILMLATEYGEDADLRNALDAPNAAGFTPLHHAVWGRQGPAVQILLQHGANMMAKNTRAAGDIVTCPPGTTPLHLAACRGHMEISRILLKSWLDRVVEPMMAQSGVGGEEATTSAIAALDPRSKANAAGHMAYHLAQRLGFFSLALLLRPNIPITRLFSAEERNVRFYGPPQLKAIAATALNKFLVASLDTIISIQSSTSLDPKSSTTTTGVSMLVLDAPPRESVMDGGDPASPGDVLLGGMTPGGALTSGRPVQRPPSLLASPSGQRPSLISPRSRSPNSLPTVGGSSVEDDEDARLAASVSDSADVASVLEDYEMPSLPEMSILPGGIGGEDSPPPSGQDSANEGASVFRMDRPGSATSQISLHPDAELEYLILQQAQLSGRAALLRPNSTPTQERLSPGPPTRPGSMRRGGPAAGNTGITGSTVAADSPRVSRLIVRSTATPAAAITAAHATATVTDPHDDLSPGGQEGGPGDQLSPSPSTPSRVGLALGDEIEISEVHDAELDIGSTDGADPSGEGAEAGSTPAEGVGEDEESSFEKCGKGGVQDLLVSAGPVDDWSADDDEDECGVCLEHPALVVISPCLHVLCGPCAKKMCSISPTKPSSCPFCRSLISNFSARPAVVPL